MTCIVEEGKRNSLQREKDYTSLCGYESKLRLRAFQIKKTLLMELGRERERGGRGGGDKLENGFMIYEAVSVSKLSY